MLVTETLKVQIPHREQSEVNETSVCESLNPGETKKDIIVKTDANVITVKPK